MTWGRATDPETGHCVVVWRTLADGLLIYSLDGDPVELVPELRAPESNLHRIAVELLLEHLRIPAPTDAEELTLP